MIRIRRIFASCAFAVLMSACTGAPAAPTVAPTATPIPTATLPPTPAPTATPAPTPTPPPLGARVFVAGVDVSGLDYAAARAQLEEELAPLMRPLDIRAGDSQLTLRAEDIDLELSIDGMLAAATRGDGVRVPLQLSYDTALLRERIESLAAEVRVPPVIDVISDTETVSRSFVLRGGADLDIADAAELIDERLRAPGAPRRITLELTAAGGDARPTPADLQAQLEAMADDWPGIAGVYVYDLASEQEIGAINERTVFNAASTIKTAIMLNAFINLDSFSKAQEEALRKMIVDSDNLAANALLSWAAGQPGTEGAIVGANQMSDMLSELGLENTYQYAPYESADYIRLYNLKIRAGPARAGEAPFTDTGRYLRTTPYEMAQVYRLIEECSRDEGVLLDEFGATLSAERCGEMIAWLEQNGDATRMMAGMPEGTIAAHKSGWIFDMQADAGIVRSSGGDYIVAIYIYRELPAAGTAIPDRIMTATIAGFSRLVYSYYNPEVVEE
jgi:beta-lactamase class A